MKFSASKYYYIALPVLAFVVGIGLSCTVYWLFLNPSNHDQSTDIVDSSSASMKEDLTLDQLPSPRVSNAPPTHVSTLGGLGAIAQIESPFDRARALRNLLSKSEEGHVLDLLADSLKLPNHTGTHELQSSIVQRLAQINPTRAMSRAMDLENRELYPSGRFVASVFREWARTNLDEAVANAKHLDDDPRRSASEAILQERMDLPEEDLRSVAHTLGDEQMANTLILQQEVERAVENPKQLWNSLVTKLQGERGQWMNIARVANAWVEEGGVTVLDQLLPTITNSQTRVYVMREVLNFAAQTDPAKALKYALKIENDVYNMALSGVVQEWARSDPQSALAAVSEIEQDTIRNSLEISIYHTWAFGDPFELMENLSALPTKHHASATNAAISSIASDSPAKAAELVTELPPGQVRTEAAQDVVFTWSRGDARAALNWVLTEPTVEGIQSQLLARVIGRLAAFDPELAWTIALEQPIPEGESGMELRVISSLASENLDSAIELLPRAREGQTRSRAYQTVIREIVYRRGVDQAFDLLKTIPESEKVAAFQSMAAAWARTDAVGLLNSMDRFETLDTKSKAAMALVITNREWRQILNEEQIEEAQDFLTERDRQELEEREADANQWW